MKSVKTILPMLFVLLILFSYQGCSGNRDNEGASKKPAPAGNIELADLYGSYWGTLPFLGKSQKLCLDVRKDSISFLSENMSVRYTNIAYSRREGTWFFETYCDGAIRKKTSPKTIGKFGLLGLKKTCIATIKSMKVTTKILNRGKDYNGEFNNRL